MTRLLFTLSSNPQPLHQKHIKINPWLLQAVKPIIIMHGLRSQGIAYCTVQNYAKVNSEKKVKTIKL